MESRLKWIGLAASLFYTTFVYGLLFSFGSLLNEMLDKFGENRSRTATVQALLVGVGLSTGVLSGILISRLGIWKLALKGAILCPLGLILSFFAKSINHLYISIGIITGLGTSLLFISCTTTIGKSFKGSQRLLALAIQNSGISLAGIVLPYLLNFFVDLYGLNGTFLILGGLYLNCIPVSVIFAILEKDKLRLERENSIRNHNNTISNDPNTSNETSHPCCGILKQELMSLKRNVSNVISIPYILHLLAVVAVAASMNSYMSLVLDILKWKGFTHSEALTAFPVLNCVGLIGSLLPGVTKQFKGVNSLVIPILVSTCGCIGQILIFSFSKLWIVLVGCALSGLAVSGVISAGIIFVVQIVGQDNMAIGVGLVNTAVGISTAALAPSFGAIRDSSGSYGTVLWLIMSLQLVGILLYTFTLITRKRMTNFNKYITPSNIEVYDTE